MDETQFPDRFLEQFLELCRQAGAALKLPDPEALARDRRAEVSGVLVSVLFDPQAGRAPLPVFADLGPLDDDQRAEQMVKLLTTNLFSAARGGPACAWDPVVQRAVLVLQAEFPDSAAALADSLKLVAVLALGIRLSLREDVDVAGRLQALAQEARGLS